MAPATMRVPHPSHTERTVFMVIKKDQQSAFKKSRVSPYLGFYWTDLTAESGMVLSFSGPVLILLCNGVYTEILEAGG